MYLIFFYIVCELALSRTLIMSIPISHNPIPKLTVKDWFDNFQKYQSDFRELSTSSFQNRCEAKQVRDETNIETKWSFKFNNELLNFRRNEINEWRNIFKNCVLKLQSEVDNLKHEEILCQREIEFLLQKFSILSECNTLRCERKRANMCPDDVEEQLRMELNLFESLRTDLTGKCDEAYLRVMELEKLIDRLEQYVYYKEEAFKIETETLHLIDHPFNISYKPELNRPINYVSYQSWLDNCEQTKLLVETELRKSVELRMQMCLPRERAHNEILAQCENTNFSFRKRMHETRYVLNDLLWQKQNLEKERDRILNEVYELEESLRNERNSLKLAESQKNNRIYRFDIELCQDQCTDNLEQQVINFNNAISKIMQKLETTRRSHNLLDEQIVSLENEIHSKRCAITVDTRCLEIRQPPNTESDESI